MARLKSTAAIFTFALMLCLGTIRTTLAAEDDEEGESKCPDKSQYTLFNPTPSKCLREFDPDRPDVTDSPFTVDADPEPDIRVENVELFCHHALLVRSLKARS
jgi:hypothetical protein